MSNDHEEQESTPKKWWQWRGGIKIVGGSGKGRKMWWKLSENEGGSDGG